MDIREFSYFLAIVDYGSITKAAEALYISQPSLSIFLKKLEERIKFPLFSRVGTKLVLTNEGRAYADYARRIVAISKEMEQYFLDLENLETGSVKIGLTSNRGSFVLSHLQLLRDKLPNIKIELVEDTSTHIEEQLNNHSIDFALLNRPFRSVELGYIPLFEEEVILGIPVCFDVSDKLHKIPESNYPWIDIAELGDCPFVLSETGQRLRQVSDFLFLTKNIIPTVYMQTRSIYNVVTSISRQVAAGFLLDSYISTYNLPTSSATFCSVGIDTPTRLQYVIAYPQDGYLSTSAQKCIDILSDVLSSSTYNRFTTEEK